MVKEKRKKKVVGSNNIIRTAIPKELNKLIVEFQLEISIKTGKKVSKQWAALQLTKQIKGGKKK